MTKREISVRPVAVADVPAVVELVRVTLAEFGLTFGAGSTTDAPLLELPRSYESIGGGFWVAEERHADARNVIGTCGVAPVDAAGETFELRKMYLRPEARGTGVGRMLLATALDFCRTKRARRVVLDTTHEMAAAIRFYERAGFVRDDDQIRGSRCSRGYSLELAPDRT